MSETIFKPAVSANTIEGNELTMPLSLVKNLLIAFHLNEINYCHWKSNEHLRASMTGDTDLDVLFDEGQKELIENLLKNLGFKKFDSIKQKQYRDIEDFIGLDCPSGKIIHLHTHYKLTLGEPYLKSYQLDLHREMLYARVWDDSFDIYRSKPELELILLCIREALKIRNRDIVKGYLKNRIDFSENTLKEYNWLIHRSTEREIKTILKGIFPNYLLIVEIILRKFNRVEVGNLSFLIRREFKRYRQFSPVNATIQRWYREVSVKTYRKIAQLLNGPVVSHRINPRGGLVIAVIGADGSGKSTVIADLHDTFIKKLDVYKIYFGRGVGRVSLPRKILLQIKKVVISAHSRKQEIKSVANNSGKKTGFIANAYKCAEALLVANEKHRNLKLMQVAKRKGMLVICDRFPQNQVMAYNDGPLLHHLSNSHYAILRLIAKVEARAYGLAEKNPPDLLFKLVADAKVVQARKPGETPLDMLEAKIEGVKSLKIADGCKVVMVDATQPIDKVLSTIKSKIWEAYL